MTPEQWQEVKAAFESTRTLPVELRQCVVAAITDQEVQREVEELIQAVAPSEDFLERPAILNLNGGMAAVAPALSGQRLGNYSLVRQIGEGGMGIVYEAKRADGEFERRVAIKLIRRWLTSDRELERFRAERQILARLDHPNIARLIDGGTTPDGLPFLVMEFVDGSRIDSYCDRNSLDIRARIELFSHVCEAVAYAHAEGIVHRDLKPANILVAAGQPKLLDFGIAKVVDPVAGPSETLTLARPGTPHYASPEQLRGEPTTPSSDIYSLGVLLYELITRQSPYAGKTQNLNSISRAVYEQEPPAPSKIAGNPDWRHNLDRIIATAMRKDPAERYPTTQDLIADLERYLHGIRVQVHRPRSRLWRRRPAVWMSAAGIALAAALLWIKGPSAFEVKTPFEKLYSEGQDRQQHFDWPAARSLFRRAVETDPNNALGHYAYSGALHTLGYESLALREAKLADDLSAGLSLENRLLIRGRYQDYRADRQAALATYTQLISLNRNNPDHSLKLANAQLRAGAPADALHTLDGTRGIKPGSTGEARIRLQRARTYAVLSKYPQELAEARAAESIADRISSRELKAESLELQGDALREMNRFEEAIKAYSECEALAREEGDLYEVASIENRLGSMSMNKGDYAALESHSNNALALFRQIDNKPAQSSILNNLSVALKSHGDLPGALNMIQQAVQISTAAGDLHGQARELTNMGTILRRLGRESDAKKAFEESLHCAEKLGDRDQIARAHITLEIVDRDGGDLTGALDHINTALNLLTGSRTVGLKALTLQHLGDDIHASGDAEGGKRAIEQSLALAREGPSALLVADDSYMLADIALEQRQFVRAWQLVKDAQTYYIAQNLKVNLWDAWITEARLRIAQSRPRGTDLKIRQAIDGFRYVKDEARECNAYAALMQSYLAQNKPEDASRAFTASRNLCASTHEYDSRMLYKIYSIRVKAALGGVAQARQELEATTRELQSKGWGQLAREARSGLSRQF